MPTDPTDVVKEIEAAWRKAIKCIESEARQIAHGRDVASLDEIRVLRDIALRLAETRGHAQNCRCFGEHTRLEGKDNEVVKVRIPSYTDSFERMNIGLGNIAVIGHGSRWTVKKEAEEG